VLDGFVFYDNYTLDETARQRRQVSRFLQQAELYLNDLERNAEKYGLEPSIRDLKRGWKTDRDFLDPPTAVALARLHAINVRGTNHRDALGRKRRRCVR